MREYHKIETLFKRDIEGTKKLIEGDFRNETISFLKELWWEWTEKVDGCLRNNTKLLQTNGEEITIAEIVENKLPVEIYGMNENGEIIPTKVVGWHNNGQTDEWYAIKYKCRHLGSKGNSYKIIRCTGNHKFYVDGEYVRADELKENQKITYLRSSQSLSYQQKQILTGLIIGDGSIANNNRSIEFSHKIDYEEYIDWLLSSLKTIAGNKQKKRISGYGTEIIPARTISNFKIAEHANQFIRNGKKYIPKEIELGPIALAIIYMDDGTLSKTKGQTDRCAIALNDYDEESVDNLICAMSTQLHLNPVKFYSNGWNLRFNIDDAETLQVLIAPYVCNCMQYKLSENYRGYFAGVIPDGIMNNTNKTFELEILSIEKETGVTHNRYDITTETHNYFANGVLVHNCNARIHWDGHKVEFGGRTDKAQMPVPLLNKLQEYFGGEENAQMFEQLFGEREVILFGEGYGAGINGGGTYMEDGKSVDFIMFDLLIGGNYQSRESVDKCADAFGVKVVPIVGQGDLYEAVDFIKTHPMSQIGPGTHEMEGIVCRPYVELNDRCHNRVIVKIKWEDFKHLV